MQVKQNLSKGSAWPGLSQDFVSSTLGKQKKGEPSEGALTWESENGACSCLCLALDFGENDISLIGFSISTLKTRNRSR